MLSAWFFGDNDAGMPIATAVEGGVFDGLNGDRLNLNQGAESILSLHLAAQTMTEVFGTRKRPWTVALPSHAEARFIRRYLTRAHDPI
jgi:hypothetical protein